MTTPPGDSLLFEVAAPPTPVERLLRLAGQYVQHNDTLDRLLRADSPSGPDAHTASAQQLASATRAAVKALTDERLFASRELSDAVVRLQQLAFLSDASIGQPLATARMLTALAPAAAMHCADTLALELRRRRRNATDAPTHQLAATHRTALWEIGCGNVVATSSQGRHYVHCLDEHVPIGTLRALETSGLAERDPKSAPSAYQAGPLQDRILLTSVGTTALAAVICSPSAPSTTAAPAATATKRTARSR
ncbi:hypothetical protein [Streptomyces sp. bgisy091]|uniref:hypothetical protein n=1 Tax=Streptomyces sp. bgisy091 TaxID=3413778 RepID=UPI003D7173A6